MLSLINIGVNVGLGFLIFKNKIWKYKSWLYNKTKREKRKIRKIKFNLI